MRVDVKSRLPAEEGVERFQRGSLPGGAEFWKRFVERATLKVQGMPKLKGERMSGGVSCSSAGTLRDCSIQINWHSAAYGPEQYKMEFWYSFGDSRIQCWYQHQRMKGVELVVHRHEVCATVAGKLLTAEQLADQIVDWMVEQVRVAASQKLH